MSEKSATWNEIPDNKVRHIWKEKTSGKEISVSPDYYQNNGTPMGEDDIDMIYVRTEITDGEPTGEQIVNLQEFSDIVGGPTDNFRNVKLDINPEGIRIRLTAKEEGVTQELDDEKNPDLLLEATPDGWKIYTHANQNEEPFSVIRVEDNGKHEGSFREENIPALS